ncbi:hypothetical protein EDD15DRAFT_2365969 [Pisolithus albus]|nr:hypothetical protein EDD15DRAFT_2365969 [Pisolithus albus]
MTSPPPHLNFPPPTKLCSPPQPALLTAIVRIDRDHFWLTADGGYLGPNAICKEILDIKPSCAFTDLGVDPVQADFPTVLDTLRILTQQCLTPGYSTATSFFTTDKKVVTGFKLRHWLFMPIDSGVKYDDESIGATAPPDDPFSFELWL